MPYSVTDYLLDRLHEVGVEHLFGVPGDFTLGMLDHVEAHRHVAWVGCANELGAGYAADGYARIRGIAALSTTFGVGELSAVNAVAGSFAEHVPVVHIVGAPTLAVQSAGRATHHSLGDGDFRHFARMSAEIACAQAFLTADNAESEIDRVISEVLERRSPGYISLPADIAERQSTPPAQPLPSHPGITNPAALELFRAACIRLLSGSASVAVLADILVQRMGAEDELHRLLWESKAPFATLLWGRRVVDESSPHYLGTYVGTVSAPSVSGPIEDSDVLIMAGVEFTDLTSGFFSARLQPSRTIDIGPRRSVVAGESLGPISMSDALSTLTDVVHALRAGAGAAPAGTPATGSARTDTAATGTAATGTAATGTAATGTAPVPDGIAHETVDVPALTESITLARGDSHPEGPLGQAELWEIVANALRPGDLVLADQGTSFYGIGAHRLPRDVLFIGQPLWASIGYTLPALLGAALASPARRPVLLIGDGAAQLTIAELGTLLRQGINATVILVDNDGYSVEKAIHGPHAEYNSIARWDWQALVTALGPEHSAWAVKAQTSTQLRDALESASLHGDRLTLIQAVVPPLDIPPLLAALASAAASANAQTSG